MKKKLMSLMLLAALLVMAMPVSAQSSKTHVVFWHSMGGLLGETLNKMVADFNASQDQVEVEAQYQGTYEESINKLKTAMRTQSGPDLIQVYEGGTRFMVDSGFILPVQQFIDADGYDISQFEENILNYYTVNGQLNSMPFNTSNPVFYYNVDMFEEAGIEKLPEDWTELTEVALKLVEAGKQQGKTQYGFAVPSSNMWFFEQPLVQQGLPLVDNDNGRSAPATRVVFDENGGALKVVTAWKQLKDSGAMGDLGMNAQDIQAAFTSGQLGITMESTASLTSLLAAIDGRFEIATMPFLPIDKSEPNGGVTLGGASLYILDNQKDEAYANAAFEFIKYLTQPQVQYEWHVNTGYYPITKAVYELPEMQEHLAARPQFQTAIDQLHNSPNMGQGAIYGSFVEGRKVFQSYIERVLMGEMSPEDAVSGMAADVNKLIENYNKANAK